MAAGSAGGAPNAAIDGVGRTAFIIARFRAQESGCAHPLVVDPYAQWFEEPDSTRAVEEFLQLLPAALQWVRLRTKYFDESLSARISAGARQVVLLGAGFDTRPLRLRHEGVRYFEVDRAAVLEYKARILLRHGVSPAAIAVPCDYVSEDFVAALDSAGFERGLPTHVVWEGNSAYIPTPAILQMLHRWHEALGAYSLSFDYLLGAVIRRQTGVPGLTAMMDDFQAMGAAWSNGLDDIAAELAQPAGMSVLEDFRTSELTRRYGVPPGPGADALEWYAVATLEQRG